MSNLTPKLDKRGLLGLVKVQIFYTLITFVLQSIGQILSLLIGWVIAVHFGRVPTRQKYILSAMGFISLFWSAMALSLTSPWVRRIISDLPVQNVPFYVKLIIPMAGIGWILLPLVNGVLAIYLLKQNRFSIKTGAIIKGYKYTPGFALAILLMLISLPILLLPPLLKGLRREHVMIMVNSRDFSAVLDDIIHILTSRGINGKLQQGTLWRRSPLAILALFAHDLIGEWAKSPARLIKGNKYQIVAHPTDLVIEGECTQVISIRNLLLKELTFSEAFFTWDGDAHRLEGKMNSIRRTLNGSNFSDCMKELKRVEQELDYLAITGEEWQTLYRQILQLQLAWSTSGLAQPRDR